MFFRSLREDTLESGIPGPLMMALGSTSAVSPSTLDTPVAIRNIIKENTIPCCETDDESLHTRHRGKPRLTTTDDTASKTTYWNHESTLYRMSSTRSVAEYSAPDSTMSTMIGRSVRYRPNICLRLIAQTRYATKATNENVVSSDKEDKS